MNTTFNIKINTSPNNSDNQKNRSMKPKVQTQSSAKGSSIKIKFPNSNTEPKKRTSISNLPNKYMRKKQKRVLREITSPCGRNCQKGVFAHNHSQCKMKKIKCPTLNSNSHLDSSLGKLTLKEKALELSKTKKFKDIDCEEIKNMKDLEDYQFKDEILEESEVKGYGGIVKMSYALVKSLVGGFSNLVDLAICKPRYLTPNQKDSSITFEEGFKIFDKPPIDAPKASNESSNIKLSNSRSERKIKRIKRKNWDNSLNGSEDKENKFPLNKVENILVSEVKENPFVKENKIHVKSVVKSFQPIIRSPNTSIIIERKSIDAQNNETESQGMKFKSLIEQSEQKSGIKTQKSNIKGSKEKTQGQEIGRSFAEILAERSQVGNEYDDLMNDTDSIFGKNSKSFFLKKPTNQQRQKSKERKTSFFKNTLKDLKKKVKFD